ncbi:hypothetical protein DFJ74DRAFT_768748 [Hyaloraphidium curvatum]|nr:hypothetical protein DFJ74DRAFT_768748 [Hyaloraphidium curvatum]
MAANPPYYDTALQFIQDLYIAWYRAPAEAAAFYTADAALKFAREGDAAAEEVDGPGVAEFYGARFTPARVDIATFDPMVIMFSRPPADDGPVPPADLATPYALLINVHGTITQAGKGGRGRRFLQTLVLQRAPAGGGYHIRNDMFRIAAPRPPGQRPRAEAPRANGLDAPAPDAPAARSPSPAKDAAPAAAPAPAAPAVEPDAARTPPPAAASGDAAEPAASKPAAAPAPAPEAASGGPKSSWANIAARASDGKPVVAAPAPVAASAGQAPAAQKPPTPPSAKPAPAPPKPSEDGPRGRQNAPVSPTVASGGPINPKDEAEVFIKGLQKPLSNEALKRAFEEAIGPVVAVMVPFADRDFGYVEFKKIEDAKRAIQMASLMFQGKAIKIVAKRARSRSRGRTAANRDKRTGPPPRRREAETLEATEGTN